MKKVAYLITVVSLSVIGVVIYSKYIADPPQDSRNDRVLQVITHKHPEFSNKNTPVIKLHSLREIEKGWYLADIRSLLDTRYNIPVYFILRENDSGIFRVILGPDTHFTETEMLQYNVPDSIIKEFNK